VIAVSGVLALAGYQLVAYGWSQLQHGNAGFFDILWPGRYTGLHPDGSSSVTIHGTKYKVPQGVVYVPVKGLNDTGAGGTIG
jgi:hypothetical protein